MKSFQQFLTEEAQVFPEFVMKFTVHYDVSRENKNTITKYFEKYNNDINYVEMDDSILTVIFKYNDQSKFHSETLDEVFFDVKEKFDVQLEQLTDGQNTIAFHERFLVFYGQMPTFKIDYPHIEIDIEPDNDLSTLYKFIECDYLTFNLFNNVKPHKGLLNILRIKAKKFIISQTVLKSAWANIYEKYLNGTRDMMDCQEELIQAGLKEYGK